MNRILIVLWVTCAITAAMVPRHRRAIDKDEANGIEGNKTENFCAPETPCGWSFFNPTTKHVELYMNNTYCVCLQGELCVTDQTSTDANYYVYQCKPEPKTLKSENLDTPVS